MQRGWGAVGLAIGIGLGGVMGACTAGPAWTVAPPAASAPPASAADSQAASLVPLGVSNGLTVAVTVVVNGSAVDTVPAGVVRAPLSVALPPLPWTGEARSPSGRVLLTRDIPKGAAVDSNSGMGARADLVCGRLDVFAGPPMLGPVYSPDPSRPCD